MQQPDDAADHLLVISEASLDGGYGVTVTAGPDVALPLDDITGLPYAQAVFDAATLAEYLCAVYRQNLAQWGHDGALAIVNDVIDRFGDHETIATWPLLFQGVLVHDAARGIQPAVHVYRQLPDTVVVPDDYEPAPVYEYTLSQTRAHAMDVVAALEIAALDRAYRDHLIHHRGFTWTDARDEVAEIQVSVLPRSSEYHHA